MPKKDKRIKNNHGGFQNKPLILADSEQEYGLVKKALGDCRFTVQCQDGIDRLCHVRGSMRKKIYVKEGDFVIISKREFQDGKADIVHVYNNDHVRMMKKEQIIKINADIKNDSDTEEKEDVPFDFETI